MGRGYLIVRDQIHMGRPVTDFDLKCMDCYHETPIFAIEPGLENVEIIISAFEKLCDGKNEFRFAESAELVRMA